MGGDPQRGAGSGGAAENSDTGGVDVPCRGVVPGELDGPGGERKDFLDWLFIEERIVDGDDGVAFRTGFLDELGFHCLAVARLESAAVDEDEKRGWLGAFGLPKVEQAIGIGSVGASADRWFLMCRSRGF